MPSLESAPLLVATDLTKRYGDLQALHAVSLSVHAGEVVGVLGQNGAGKTTLLECILGIRSADRGQVTLDGVDMAKDPALAKNALGAQLQTGALPAKMTAREALTLYAGFYRKPRATGELIAAFGLEPFAAKSFESLSVGQRQRVALALAFLPDPRVVVLDEPTAGLDPAGKGELMETIASWKRRGIGILFSTHDLAEAERVCDRVIILHEGKVRRVVEPKALKTVLAGRAVLRFRTSPEISLTELSTLPDVENAEFVSGEWILKVSAAERTLAALSRELVRQGGRWQSLSLQPPSLEEVFLELTTEREVGP